MPIFVFCKRNNSLNHLLTFILSTLLVTACGLSGDRGGTNGQPSSNNGGNNNGNNLENDTFSIKEKIGINVERINGDINKVSTTQISIVSLSESFRETGSGSTPSYRVEKREIGGYEIQFATSYIERVNQVVKVTFNNQSTPKEILYAPLYTLKNDTESINVNAKSHYLLKKLFDSVDTSSQLSLLLPCSSSTSTCANQPMAKSNTLQQINTAVAAYNVDIPSSANVTQAINILDQRLDLRQHVESAINEITRTQSPIAKGTRRGFDPIASPITSQYYHSVYFGLSLSNVKPDDDNRTVKVSSSSSTIINGTNNAYPGFNQSTSLLDMRRDVLSSDIPFERTNLQISENNSFTLIDNEEINSLTSVLTDSFLSTQGFLLNERVLNQTTNSSKTVGWEFEPLFSRTYQTNEYEPDPDALSNDEVVPDYGSAPTWLVSSNYSKAANYSLSGSSAPFRRVEQLEDMHLFSWEVHGLETNKDPGFKVSSMNGKQYGAISYSLKVNDESNSNVMQLIAETAKWEISSNISSGTISMSQPTDHYKTLSLSRADNNATLGVRTENNLLGTNRTISRLATANHDQPYHGLISFGGSGQGSQPQGHSTANGSYMSLAFNTKEKLDPLDRGQGIILASELANSNFLFSGELYQLQGNSFEMTNEKNIIHQLNGSNLEITSESSAPNIDCQATLSIKRTSVEHTVDFLVNTLSAPKESSQNDILSQSCTLDGSEISIEFSSVFSEPLTLRGFITQKNDDTTNKPGNLINLIWQQDNQLGLIFANKEQDLSPTFDN